MAKAFYMMRKDGVRWVVPENHKLKFLAMGCLMAGAVPDALVERVPSQPIPFHKFQAELKNNPPNRPEQRVEDDAIPPAPSPVAQSTSAPSAKKRRRAKAGG